MVRGPPPQRVVQHAMPGDALLAGQAISEDVRPSADDLVVDALFVHPFVTFRDGLDQARKEWPHLEAVVETERLFAAVGGCEFYADDAAFAFDRCDELRR